MCIKRILLSILISAFSCAGFSQKKVPAKYPSLFWEITGNGLQKPSYLFGTMHVSNKMVFHLSDSFYLAIKSVEAVALELNPDLWQGQMVSLDKLKRNYANFTQAAGNDYLTENSFRIDNYENELKLAMSTEPTVVNSLLYRSYKSRQDFEEDTFLDLSIFQTGKKLGKRATGVENYFETEKLIMEAYMDMALEKKRKSVDTEGESNEDIFGKMQEAYRKGDLDLMDSLDRMMERSDAFREKFLYKRNEIQANSMDTIMKNSSLFVGVGAAHLAGERGVIELLRKKGYNLRPIQMLDRDALQKETIDKMKVPVEFINRQSDDGFYSVAMPGPLFKLGDDNQELDRRQYSDMSNGAYYIVTRVKAHAGFLGQDQQAVVKKVDSILYENIPGKILSKKNITRNGYPGYDISNRTRRGDLQRYNIFVTPFEVLVFKMSGNENYVDGKEAEQFFSSIQLKQTNNTPVVFQPAQGGFSIKLPQSPHEYLNTADDDRWEYEAVDPATGDAYLVFKRSVDNFLFLDQDTFDLSLVEESFRSPDYFDKQLSRTPGSFSGYPSLDVKEKMKDGWEVRAKYIIKGPDHYVIAARSKKKNAVNEFFDSFRFTDYKYKPTTTYVDTFMHFSVNTPIIPQLDDSIRRLIEKATYEVPLSNNYSGYSPYWPKARNGLFRSDSTGEEIGITIQEYPKYYFVRDPANFWKNELTSYSKTEMVVFNIDSIRNNNVMMGYKFSLKDTGSSRIISRMVVIKDNYRYSLVSMGDSLRPKSPIIDGFFNSFKALGKKPSRNIFDNKLEEFFTDLFSGDSATRAKAQQSIGNIYYGEKGVPKIMEAIGRLSISDKNYFETKAKLIGELGYIKDSTNPVVVEHLKKLYEQAKDTSLLQNQVLIALSHHKTAESYKLFKQLVLEDPPLFDNKYEYNTLFSSLDDSLKLTRLLFPDLLQLSSVDDYKDKVLGLLVTLVDSNIVKANEYESYFSKIYFDARIELKKQQGKDEKQMELDSKKDNEQSGGYSYSNNNYGNANLRNYQVLLVPFYDKNTNVQHFFEKLLLSKDPLVRLNVAVLLLRNNINVADSVLQILAAKDQFRGRLYTRLEKAKRLDKFPAQYKNQLDLARSYLVEDKDYDKIDSVVFLRKQYAAYPGKKGTVYFFKYRIKKEGDWKIGISGLQPENEKEVSSDDALSTMTDKKLKPEEPMDDQLQKQLRKLLFTFHKSAKNFYVSDDMYSRYRKMINYQEEE